MASQKSISDLAGLIQNKTKILEDGTKGQPGSDFSLAFAMPPPAVNLDPSLENVRNQIIEAADELKARLQGPFGHLASLVLPVPTLTVILDSLYHFNIPAQVPASVPGESITYESLAKACDMPLDDLRRVVQGAISYRIFEEVEPDVSVRHNAASALFVIVPGFRDLLGHLVSDHRLGASKFVESIRRFPGSGEPGHSPLLFAARAEKGLSNDHVEDPSQGFFSFIADDETRVARSRNAMGMATRAPGYAASYFLDNVPWSTQQQCPKTVVDIGGAGGDLSVQILRRFSGIGKTISLDLPEVIETATVPEDLKDRLQLAPYNFLTQKMSYKGDVYVFRHIFHDWSDQYAVKILKNLVPALEDGTRVWINEIVLPELSEDNHVADQRRRCADLLMKVGFNGKERSRRGWENVFAEADKRFKIQSIVQPEGASDAVIEVLFSA